MIEVNSFQIERNGHTYDVSVVVDENPLNPRKEYDHCATEMYVTQYTYSRWDVYVNELDSDAGAALKNFIDDRRQAGSPEWRDEVARAFHIWTVITGSPVVLFMGDDHGYLQGYWHYWFMLVDTDIVREEYSDGTDAETIAKIEADEYAAYAYGDVFGVIASLNGREIDSLWGIVDRKGDYVSEVAEDMVDQHEKWLQREAAKAGAGFIGVI